MYRRLIDFEPTADPSEGGEGGAAPVEPAPTAFSQADVDRIVRERLARQKAQFGDYEDLRAKADKFDELESASQSELEKAQKRLSDLEREATEAKERAQKVLTESAIVAAAAGKLADPTDAVALIDRAAIEYGPDGAPANVAALVDGLVEAKPHLAASAPRPVPVDLGARGSAPAGPLDKDALLALPDDAFLKSVGAGISK